MSAARWKVDLHTHSAEDPHDEVAHSAVELLQRAKALGFDALAITLHGHVLARPEIFESARALGVRLIPAAEMRLEGADVVILNICEEEAAGLNSLGDLARLRAERGGSILVLAPHPFYVLGGSIGARRLEAHIDCFDAIEYCHFHTRGWNLNRAAAAIAERHGKPLLATSDAHRLDFFGGHYSLVSLDAGAFPEALFDAIRAGRIERVSPPWPWLKLAGYLLHLFIIHPAQKLAARL